MEIFKIENLNFTYSQNTKKALDNINITINQGEFVLLCGKSGCGKTTLLRLLKPVLSPFGILKGNIYFQNKLLEEWSAKTQAAKIGFVMQNPDNQIVTDKVWHELSFGLESLGAKQNQIRAAVSETASFFGIQNWFYKNVQELSGGQKQLLNLASVMVMQPSVIILDEPTSQLDPIAAGEFLNALKKINRELGTTIILSEHRLEDVFSVADKVIVMDNGKIVANDEPVSVVKILKEKNHDMFLSLPTPVRVHGAVINSLPCPLTVKDGRNWLCEYSKTNTLNPQSIPKDALYQDNDTALEVKDIWFRYKKDLPDVVKGFSLKVNKGELFCLMGGNGTGKTTALTVISGINKPYRGKVVINGQDISKIDNLYNGLLAVLPQSPQSVFVKKTVYLDLCEALAEGKLTKEQIQQQVQKAIGICQLENLLNTHPYDLSGGEQQRAALAKVLLANPKILLLDEPTKGMDAKFKEEFANILLNLKSKGVTVIMVSHDIEFCAEYADRCALMFDGKIVSADTPGEFFKGNSFYTTSANRMARTILPDAVLADDIIKACGGTVNNVKKNIERSCLPSNDIKEQKIKSDVLKSDLCTDSTQNKSVTAKKLNSNYTKRMVSSLIIILMLIPFTIYAGVYFFGDRKYYFISLLIILETLIPFCMMFESRKPKARELIVISVLCAIAVAGRVAFFMVPQFKPVVAIVIVAGVCFGAETGFLVGAVTGFVSNFFFGQGPWTPWQMFAFGIIGFVSGIIFKKGFLKKTKFQLCIFGFLATLVIYGGIMNPASIVMWQNKITTQMLVSAYIMGFPFDMVHAISTAFFLWFISEPMIEKLDRIKLKYGLIER